MAQPIADYVIKPASYNDTTILIETDQCNHSQYSTIITRITGVKQVHSCIYTKRTRPAAHCTSKYPIVLQFVPSDNRHE